MVGLVLQTNGSLWEAFSGTWIPWELVLPVDVPEGVSRSEWGSRGLAGVSWVCAAAAAEPGHAARFSAGVWKRSRSCSAVFLTGPFTLDSRLI